MPNNVREEALNNLAGALDAHRQAVADIEQVWPQVVAQDEQLFRVGIMDDVPLRRIFGGGEARPVRLLDGAIPKEDPERKKGEDLFRTILSSLREIYDVEGVIAGGAVRDLAAGVDNHKDVDVFITIDPKVMDKHALELGWMGEPYKVKMPNVKKYKEAGAKNPEPYKVVERWQGMVQGVLVDLVLTKEPLSPKHVKGFPIHAQRCVWSLADGLVVAPEAQKDIDNKQFTIDPSIKDEKYIEALKGKIGELLKRKEYKGWKMNAPKAVAWWAEVNDKFGKKKKVKKNA